MSTKKIKKYGVGSGRMGTTFIEDPATTIAENNIMMAQASQEAASNKWLPVVAMASQIAQSAIMSGAGKKTSAIDTEDDTDIDASMKEGVVAAMGNSGVGGQVEVEGKEVIQTPNGEVAKVEGASHENGGVNVSLPAGTRIYSKRVEKFGESMAERKEAREKKKANLEKLISDRPDDIAIKNAHSRTLATLAKEEEEDLRTQEMYGVVAAIHEFAYGTNEDGTPMYRTGTSIDGIEEDPKNLNLLPKYNPFSMVEEQPNLEGLDPTVINVADKDLVENNISDGGIAPVVNKTAKTEEDEEGSTFGNILGSINIGDAVGMFGNIYSATEPMKNTLANRASDTANINAFKDFGKDALDANLLAMENAASNKNSTITRIASQARGLKRSGRNSARGVNQMRAMDLATDVNVNDANQGANDSFVNTMTQLLSHKAQLENHQDSAVMQGEQQRDLADRQDKDNFYTQMGKDINTKGKGIQTIGKDLNAIKQNEMIENLMNNLSKYGLAFDANGNLIQKTQTTK